MTEITTDQMRRFVKLFSGYTGAYGRFDVKQASASGKVEGRAVTERSKITREAVENHFTGRGGIGIIPLRDDDSSVAFAAIDVDVKEFPSVDPEQVARDCYSRNLPVVVCRSKSGGCHIYFFFSDPYPPAKAVRAILHTVTADLGFGGAEIFPKQESRASATDTGNWINMPYESGDATSRYAYSDEGERLTFAEFLDVAEARRVSELTVFGAMAELKGDLFQDGPPCLQRICASGGFPEGTRNEGMFSVAVYAKKAYGDNWQSKFAEMNSSMCSPALPSEELRVIERQMAKKDYAYKCKTSPLKPVCDRRMCLSRRFGVGENADGHGVDIENITKYAGDPPIWCLSISGRRIEVDTDTLLNHKLFAKAMVEAFNNLPPSINAQKWSEYLSPLLKNCDEVASPEEVSPEVQFQLFFANWVNGATQAKTAHEMLQHKPYRSNGKVYFLSESLQRKLDGDRFKYKNMHQVWSWLKTMGAGRDKSMNLKGVVKNPWFVVDTFGGTVDITDAPSLANMETQDEEF